MSYITQTAILTELEDLRDRWDRSQDTAELYALDERMTELEAMLDEPALVYAD
jgi:hypothetical protein